MLPRFVSVINLASATGRWAAVEASHRAHLGDAVELVRIEAIGTTEVQAAGIRGRLSPAEKGCYLSHLDALKKAATAPSQIHWIAEDDVVFGPSTRTRLTSVLEKLAHTRWDILFTDVIVAGAASAIDVWTRARRQQELGGTGFMNLSGVAFGGTMSYLVNAHAAARILRLTAEAAELNLAWDVMLRALGQQGKLTELVTLPFLTQASRAPSQIQPDPDQVASWGNLRDLLFCDADLDAIESRLASGAPPSQQAMIFGHLMATMAEQRPTEENALQRRADSTARTSSASSRSSLTKS